MSKQPEVSPAPRSPARWQGAVVLAGSILLHVGVLAAVPALDTPAGCPVLHVTLETAQAMSAELSLAPPSEPHKAEATAARAEPNVVRPQVAIQRRASRQRERVEHAPVQLSPPKPAPTPPAAQPAATVQNSAETATEQGPPAAAAADDFAQAFEPAAGRPNAGGEGASGTGPPDNSGARSGPGGSGASEGVAAAPVVDYAGNRASYQAYVLGRIAAYKQYPAELITAERKGESVTVKVRLRILPGGQLEFVEVTQSSGLPQLDQAALATVRAAVPFKPFTKAELDKTSLTYSVPLKYTLR